MNGGAGQELLSQLTSAAIVVYALEALKRWAWCSWLTVDTRRANQVAAAIGALAAAVGIHFAFDASAAAAGTYVITVSGLTFSSFIHGAWHWINQWALQQLAYDATQSSRPPAPPVVRPSVQLQ